MLIKVLFIKLWVCVIQPRKSGSNNKRAKQEKQEGHPIVCLES